MVLIHKRPWFSGNKHEPRMCLFIHPLEHAFIDAIDPAWDKFLCHFGTPSIQPSPGLPKIDPDRVVDLLMSIQGCLVCSQSDCKTQKQQDEREHLQKCQIIP